MPALVLSLIQLKVTPKFNIDTNGATVLLYYIIFSSTLQGLYQDKSNRMTDVLRIMGLKWRSYIFSYFLVEFCIGSIFTLITCYLSVEFKGYDTDKSMKFLLSASVFLLSNIALAFLLSSLISNSRLGNFLGIILLIFSLTIYEVIVHTSTKWWHYVIMYIIPYCSFGDTLKLIYRGGNDAEFLLLILAQLVPLSLTFLLFFLIESCNGTDSIFVSSLSSCIGCKEQNEERSNQLLNSNILLKVEDLYKRYGSFYALNGVSLEMYQGEIFGLLGPNGAGKTTLINILLGNVKLSYGSIQANKTSLQIGYCPQETILFEELTLIQHLELFANIKGEPHTNLNQIMQVLQLTDSKNKKASMLSGGQRRKLAVGLAFIGKESLIVLDEPTVGMDVDSRQGLWKLIRENKENRLIILTTQNLEEADELSDRIAILSSGVLVDQPQAPIQWKRKYGYGYKLIVEADKNEELSEAERIVKNITGNEAITEHEQLGKVTFNLSMPDLKAYQELFAELEEHKGLKMTLEYSTLEDAYLNIADKKSELAKTISAKSELDTLVLNSKGQSSSLAQFIGLLNIRWLVMKRNWKRWIESTVPLLLIFISGFAYFHDSKNIVLQYVASRIAAPFIAIACGCMLPTSIYTPVLEKQQKLTQILEINHVHKLIYWSSYILSELFISTISILAIHLILYIL